MAIYGSKHMYKTATTHFCQNPPAIIFQIHKNGWLDAALASGITGTLLLLLVMWNPTAQGFRMIEAGAE